MSERTISLQDFQVRGDEILREAEAGQQFTVLVERRPVAILGPCGKRQWVPKAELLAILRDLPADLTLQEDLAGLELREHVDRLMRRDQTQSVADIDEQIRQERESWSE